MKVVLLLHHIFITSKSWGAKVSLGLGLQIKFLLNIGLLLSLCKILCYLLQSFHFSGFLKFQNGPFATFTNIAIIPRKIKEFE